MMQIKQQILAPFNATQQADDIASSLGGKTIGGTLNVDGRAAFSDPSNTFIGDNTGSSALSHTSANEGWGNVAVGGYSLNSLTIGDDNTAVGYKVLMNLTTGVDNTAMGQNSGIELTTGGWNSLYGEGSAEALVDGDHNTALGFWTARAATTGSYGVVIGSNALIAADSLLAQTVVGARAGDSVTTASALVLIGKDCARNLTTGTTNVIIGYNTAGGLTTGAKNTIIGSNITGLSSSMSNNILLADGDGKIRVQVDANGIIGVNRTGTDLAGVRLFATAKDAYVSFGDNTQNWTVGVDNDDGSQFKLSRSNGALGTNDVIAFDSSGVMDYNHGSTAASVAGDFSADEYIEVKIAGATRYIPVTASVW